MDKHELERNLSVRRCYGFPYDTGNPDYLGALWIVVDSPSRFPSHDPVSEPELFASWKQLRDEKQNAPYLVVIREIRKAIAEADIDPDEDDVQLEEEHRFASLDELEDFTSNRFGKRIADFQFAGDFIPYW